VVNTSQHRPGASGVLAEFRNGVIRLAKILLIEHRLPIRFYKLFYGFLYRLGKQFVSIKLDNGYTIKGFSKSFWMFYETWDKRDYDIPGFSLADGMNVVDIGANQGFFALYAASKGARVYAFEPCVENFAVLSWNVAKNGLEDRVKLFNAAVTGREGEVALFVGRDAFGNILSETVSTCRPVTGGTSAETSMVTSVTMDSLLSDLNISRCNLLKVDCEGAEYDILRSISRESFRKIERISMECHERRIEEAATILKEAGFETSCEDFGWLGMLKATNKLSEEPASGQ